MSSPTVSTRPCRVLPDCPLWRRRRWTMRKVDRCSARRFRLPPAPGGTWTYRRPGGPVGPVAETWPPGSPGRFPATDRPGDSRTVRSNRPGRMAAAAASGMYCTAGKRKAEGSAVARCCVSRRTQHVAVRRGHQPRPVHPRGPGGGPGPVRVASCTAGPVYACTPRGAVAPGSGATAQRRLAASVANARAALM
jgi:hypothetical protein